jgi:sulfane dehydrogenase subunit SoxC
VLTRRSFLALSLDAALAAWASRAAAASRCGPDPFAGGRLLRTIPLTGRGARVMPLETMIGRGLDARRFTDLSGIGPDTLIIPTSRFFVRTGSPDPPPDPAAWTIRVHGLVDRPAALTPVDLARRARPMGAHLLECAGNTEAGDFGLIGVATWTGVPLAEILEDVPRHPQATRVLVSGYDVHPAASRRSQPGASWVFSLDELYETGAFLATGMNGEPLPPDHGAPVRLVVPGWYACAHVKWVNEIVLVGEDTPSTPQMREFAARTHQHGVPELAREFEPPVVDAAAMPVRVEQWRVDAGLLYRIVGLVWGGRSLLSSLRIGFGGRVPEEVVEVCPPAEPAAPWALWTHAWKPGAPGRYRLWLKPLDASVRARRLDLYFYARDVVIEEV